jgi:hypothetical protein
MKNRSILKDGTFVDGKSIPIIDRVPVRLNVAFFSLWGLVVNGPYYLSEKRHIEERVRF